MLLIFTGSCSESLTAPIGAAEIKSNSHEVKYSCSLFSHLESGDLERTCINGYWTGDPPKCFDYCDTWPLQSIGFELYEVSVSEGSRRVTTRGVHKNIEFSIVCRSGRHPSTTSNSLLFQMLNCNTLPQFLATKITCVANASDPQPQFTLTAGLAFDSFVLDGATVNNAEVVYHYPHTALQLQTNVNKIKFIPKGYFSVGRAFSWYSFVRPSHSPIDSIIPIISWKSHDGTL